MLLSWRVHVLPFIGQMKLYRQFHLDEPWDSEHNRKLIAEMPAIFRCPRSNHNLTDGRSTYRVVSGDRTAFPGRQGLKIKEIIDGTSNTILFVEVSDDHSVFWTKPEGLYFDPENPVKGMGGQFKDGFYAAFCDGSVRFLGNNLDPEILRLLIFRNDDQPIPAY